MMSPESKKMKKKTEISLRKNIISLLCDKDEERMATKEKIIKSAPILLSKIQILFCYNMKVVTLVMYCKRPI